MLVLTQHIGRPDDDIFISEDIMVKVIGIVSDGTAVKIAIAAPKNIPILRRSVRDRKESGNADNS